jgi:hypothetical protein
MSQSRPRNVVVEFLDYEAALACHRRDEIVILGHR